MESVQSLNTHLPGPGLWHDLFVRHFQRSQLLRYNFFSLSLPSADVELPNWSLRICFLPADQEILLVMTLFPDCVMSWSILLPYHLGRFTENAVWRNATKSCSWAQVRQVPSLCPNTQTELPVLENCNIDLWLLKEHHREHGLHLESRYFW